MQTLLALLHAACLCIWLPVLWVSVDAGPGVLSTPVGIAAALMAWLSLIELVSLARSLAFR